MRNAHVVRPAFTRGFWNSNSNASRSLPITNSGSDAFELSKGRRKMHDTDYNVTILSTRGGLDDSGSTDRIFDGRIKVDTLVDIESESVVRAPGQATTNRQSGIVGYNSAYQHSGSQPGHARRDS